ncbi:MAG TPA: hypothetical protein VEY09_05625 [Pyrinomonadaceae bacterium]|nr:hypothetical protein [Pyrinomonadaceae bacterium]
MKRVLTCLVCFVFLLTTVAPEVFGQTRRKKSKFGRKARTAAIVAGGAGVGALVGGKKGAAIGAGGAGLYAFNRRAARRNFRGRTRTVGSVASGAALGAGTGAALGGKRAAAAGAAIGGTGGYLYRKSKPRRRVVRRY